MFFTANDLRTHKYENSLRFRIKANKCYREAMKHVNQTIWYAHRKGATDHNIVISYDGPIHCSIDPSDQILEYQWYDNIVPRIMKKLEKRGFSVKLTNNSYYLLVNWKGDNKS